MVGGCTLMVGGGAAELAFMLRLGVRMQGKVQKWIVSNLFMADGATQCVACVHRAGVVWQGPRLHVAV